MKSKLLSSSVAVTMLLSNPAFAAEFMVLHRFTVANEGGRPIGTPVLDGKGNLYGTTHGVDSASNPVQTGEYGVIWKIKNPGTATSTSGVSFEVLHAFDGTKGRQPDGHLIADTDGNLFGTARYGGSGSGGTVFRYDRALGTVRALKEFGSTFSDGGQPIAGLTRDADGNFYGTTLAGGDSSSCGTVFKLTPANPTSGTFSYSVLKTFVTGAGCGVHGPVFLLGDVLYGTTAESWVSGSLFSVKTDGTSYAGINPSIYIYGLSNSFVHWDSKLWGTAGFGGANSIGAIYSRTTSGTLTLAYTFPGDNSKGSYPMGVMALDEATGLMYGTTLGGSQGHNENTLSNGTNVGHGTVFQFNPSTGTVTTLHTFDGTDGKQPFGGLVRDSAGYLYGITEYGGGTGYKGTVFRIKP